MMSEDQFWNLISDAKASVGDAKEIPDWLEQKLLELPSEEIIDFGSWLATFAGRSYDAKLWAAASIIGGLSSDGFFGFRGWLIAQGKTVYENALQEPDSLVDIEVFETGMIYPSVSLEKLFYVWFRAYNHKLGRPSYTAVELPPDYRPPSGSQPNPPPEVTMESIHEQVQQELTAWLDDQVKLAARFPKLLNKFKQH